MLTRVMLVRSIAAGAGCKIRVRRFPTNDKPVERMVASRRDPIVSAVPPRRNHPLRGVDKSHVLGRLNAEGIRGHAEPSEFMGFATITMSGCSPSTGRSLLGPCW